ncbi:MAG TPA: hypothetical protein VFM14_03685 [Gemmatimonadales bacterium]|nr:hypothetical protein [Gemmatimonadales bacterium]
MLLAAIAACQLATARPSFDPFPEARHADVALSRAEATELLAEALRADSIPVTRVEPRDGYVETPWFDAETGRPTSKRPVGRGIVRVRGWVEPARVRHSELRVETVFRRMVDPSLPERELERQVAAEHPVAQRVDSVLAELARRYEGQLR